MPKKEQQYNPEEEADDDNDDDLDLIRDAVFRAILKNNRIMLRQNNQIIEQLEQLDK